MRLSTLVTFLALSGVVSANITGQHPVSGTCLCVTGTNVNARSSAGLSSSVVASVSTPSCYKFHGGILTKDGYTWYQLQHVNGHNAWLAGTFLSIGTSSQCSTSSSSGSSTACHDATAQDLACKLKALADAGTITLWNKHPSGVHDNAYAYNNIRDACNGHAASRSHYSCSTCTTGTPGGSVCLSKTLLQYIYSVHQQLGYIHVNEIAGACHSCTSKHYRGLAVDLHNPTTAQSNTMRTLCTNLGGFAQDEGNHVHCQVPA